MPTYDYHCPKCGAYLSRHVSIEARRSQRCFICDSPLDLLIRAVPVKVVGKAVEGGGPDRFTADALGIPLKELPAGLRTKERK